MPTVKGPTITFNVHNTNKKSRQLILNRQGITCKRGAKIEFETGPNSDLHAVKKLNDKTFEIQVIKSFRFIAQDANEIRRIVDSVAGLGLCEASIQEKTEPDENATRFEDFEILNVVGEGAFGQVMKVRERKTDSIYALKAVSMLDFDGDVRSEERILSQLHHPFIVDFKCSFEDKGCFYLLMEFAENGDLRTLFSRVGRLKESSARLYIAEILLAIEYLHQKQIIYRDLKPENVLVCRDGHLKLADFGLSKHGPKATTFCGTPHYLAPEVLIGQPYEFSVDHWSLGIIAFEMLVAQVPFRHENRNEMYKSMLKGEITFPVFVSNKAKSFIRSVLVRRPEDRLGSGSIGVLEIKHHPFFSVIHWQQLMDKQVAPPNIPLIGAQSEGSLFRNDTERSSDLLSNSSTPKGKVGVNLFANIDFRKKERNNDSIDDFINEMNQV